jgi:hypothetical protein
MVMTCNTLPAVPDNDGGTWRRIRVIEFGSKFVLSRPSFNEMDPDLNPSSSAGAFIMMLTLRCVADRGQKLGRAPSACRHREVMPSRTC